MKKTLSSANIKLIVYDFDGVMTDNRVLTSEDGTESVWVNRADGMGISIIKSMGIPQMILSTETNKVVKARGRKVALAVLMGIKDKRVALEKFCQKKGVSLQKTLYVGNDINDLEAMKLVGFPVAPADAHPTILKMAKLVMNTPGGYGVIRELADRLT